MASKFPNQISDNPFIKSATDAIYNNRESLVPIFAITAFGGTVVYLIHRGRSRRVAQAQVPNQDDLKSGPAKKSISTDESLTNVVLSDLPPETRSKIWEILEYKDLLKLRLVAGFTKEDVENWVGVRVQISSRIPEQYEFAQKVALQSCLITDLSADVNDDFFLNPSLMREIEVIEHSAINLTSLINILVPCVNLRRLKLHFLYSMNVKEISEVVLHSIQYMQNLEELQLFRISINNPTLKFVPQQIPRLPGFVSPTKLTNIELEIPDVPEHLIAVWKYILEKQRHLKNLSINFGAVHWHLVQNVIPKNPGLERINLDGFCNLNPESEIREPFDWTIFEGCANLKNFEIGCPPLIDSQEYESMPSINFKQFPCKNIEEFYVYKVILSPEDVRRIYTKMRKMTSGSLNQIGEAGTEAAAEMYWIHVQHQENIRREWLEREQWWDLIANSVLGFAVLTSLFVASKLRSVDDVVENREIERWSANQRGGSR